MKFFNQKGFTLIELMTTVVIIGIIASMAVPRFQIAYERMEFKTANKNLASKLKMARSMAISNKETFGVNFEPTTRVVTLFKKDTSSVLLNTFEVTDSLVSVDTLTKAFTNLSTDLVGNSISFRPNGSAIFSGGGNIISVTFTESIVAINQINILASTGRVHSEGFYY